MDYKAVAAWNFIAGAIGPYGGFGLPSSGRASGSGLTNLTIQLFIDGGALAVSTHNIAVTETDIVASVDVLGGTGRDFSVKYSGRSVGGGKRLIAPIEVVIDPQRARD